MHSLTVNLEDLEVTELTPTRVQVAFRAALKELNIPHFIEKSGETFFEDELDLDYFEEDTFRAVFEQKLNEASVDATLTNLVRDGLVNRNWNPNKDEFEYSLV